jgi:hypothetical protein
MIKIDYIEEAGQYYYQCVNEIQFMNLVTSSISYDHDNFYNIIHNGTTVKKRRIGKKRIFNYSMS